jgi:hypothetical protein
LTIVREIRDTVASPKGPSQTELLRKIGVDLESIDPQNLAGSAGIDWPRKPPSKFTIRKRVLSPAVSQAPEPIKTPKIERHRETSV